MQRINLDEKFGLFTDHWRPKIIAAANGQEVKIVKVQGEFPWDHHDTEDEFFMVLEGSLLIDFEDRVVELGRRQAITVPKGVRHRPRAPERTVVVMVEGAGVVPTGD